MAGAEKGLGLLSAKALPPSEMNTVSTEQVAGFYQQSAARASTSRPYGHLARSDHLK